MRETRRLIVTATEYAIIRVEEKSENWDLMGYIAYCSMPMITAHWSNTGIPQSKLQGLNQTQVKKLEYTR
jgi:hypothetical protein